MSKDRAHTDTEADTALSLALVRRIAQDQIEAIRQRASDPHDHGRSLPLPVSTAEHVSIGEALRAAVHQLETLERELGRQSGDDDSSEPTVPAHIAEAARRAR
ncbi:MAG: hypothetical protein EBZ50_02480 [Alphaproteobacteria bacterium]|nr:hypothetical protein [Alphaproteobacteria bacterium]